MRNASGHNYWNSSFIIDVAMGQIPRSTERISSLVNILQKARKEVRVCEVTRVVGQLSIVCSRSQIASMIVGRSADWESSNIIMIFG